MTLSPGKSRDVVIAESELIWPTVKSLNLSYGCDAGIEFIFFCAPTRRGWGRGGAKGCRIFIRLRKLVLWRIRMLCRGMLTSTVRLWGGCFFFLEKRGRIESAPELSGFG